MEKGSQKRKCRATKSASDDDNDEDFVEEKPAPRKARRIAKGDRQEASPDAGDAGAADEPKWMEKYQRHDLKTTKGELTGLLPYIVGQITAINTKTSSSHGAKLDALCLFEYVFRIFGTTWCV
jgi:hypothetical protein